MHTKIVGVTHPNSDGSSRQRILKRMRREEREYEAVYLEPEPDNPYDKNAIKVLNTEGEQLGYLNSDLAEDIARRMSCGEDFSAVITNFTGDDEDKQTIGCNIEITASQSRSRKVPKEESLLNSFVVCMGLLLIAIPLWVVVVKQSSKKDNTSVKSYTYSSLRTSSDVKISPSILTKEEHSTFAKSLDKKAEEKRAAQKKAEAQELYELRKKMTSTTDEVEGTKWIYEKTTKRLIDRRISRKNFFYVYLGQSGRTMWPRLRMGFIRDGWIFFNQVIVNVDGNVRRLSFGKFSSNRDVLGAGAISEYIDVSAGDYESLIKSMAKGKKVIVRFEGSQYFHDFTMTKEQKTALSNIWRLYELMR